MSTVRHRAGLWLAGFLWGLAEATVFFVVPDVLLTIVAQRRGLFPALAVSLVVVVGAMLGGLAMWWIGGAYPGAAISFLDHIPATSKDMIDAARAALAHEPFEALLAGAFSGAPYKVFGATAQVAGVSAPGFLLITIPARAVRFVLAIVVTVVIDRVAAMWLSSRARLSILAGFWVVFYAVFWVVMPN